MPAARPAAQTLPEWQRVYTFEDSFIDINTSWIFNDSDGVFRVTFRWSFERPEALAGDPSVRYKSRVEVFQFDCEGRRFRPREVTLFDERGRAVGPGWKETEGAWRVVPSGGMTEKLLRKHVGKAPRSQGRQVSWREAFGVGAPHARVCDAECLG
ncbi:MAG TPA: surface-adhesin E family protein, partial [Rubricoccaceae bacterium]|nr:surface-adhesin E family protein [Rubricoccaceae bacterium]